MNNKQKILIGFRCFNTPDVSSSNTKLISNSERSNKNLIKIILKKFIKKTTKLLEKRNDTDGRILTAMMIISTAINFAS